MTGHRWNWHANICEARGVTKQGIAEGTVSAIC
jgi:hypothetical protein